MGNCHAARFLRVFVMMMTAPHMNPYPAIVFESGNNVAAVHRIIHTIHTASMGVFIFPTFFDSLVRFLDRLRQDACLTDDGHEIRISRPARDDVHVNVVRHARSRCLADVRADVECLWMVDFFQDHHRLRNQFHHFSARLGVEQFQRGLVIQRCDHQVAVGVGIQVDDDEGALSAMQDQVLVAVFLFCQGIAEYAPVFFFVAFNIVLAPGGGHSFHVAILAEKSQKPVFSQKTVSGNLLTLLLAWSILARVTQPSLFASVQWTVSRLTQHLRQVIESDPALQDVWVRGELSNVSRPASGHLYFTLKDSGASLRGVMWKLDAARLKLPLRDGMEVEAHGRIGIYEVGGQYQLYADVLRPVGEGALYAEFLRLKSMLEAEGLFDASRKRPIPELPRCIGIVTSSTGAALRDMLNTLRRRLPFVDVILAPSPVQGADAAPALVTALQKLNRFHPDVILVARGGGSIEDLWAFNEERVVRAVAASDAPVISGVGHETDFTLIDFAADLRAPTPTAAAELATPVTLFDLASGMSDLGQRAEMAINSLLERGRIECSNIESRLRFYSPSRKLQSERQRADEWTRRLLGAQSHRLALEAGKIEGMGKRLVALNPFEVLARGYVSDGNFNAKIVNRKS
jgi:exodeoxyribonuclease VII large subunit